MSLLRASALFRLLMSVSCSISFTPIIQADFYLLPRPQSVQEEQYWQFTGDTFPSTPRGPSLDIPPSPKQIVKWAEKTGKLRLSDPVIDLPPWHYGLTLVKQD